MEIFLPCCGLYAPGDRIRANVNSSLTVSRRSFSSVGGDDDKTPDHVRVGQAFGGVAGEGW